MAWNGSDKSAVHSPAQAANRSANKSTARGKSFSKNLIVLLSVLVVVALGIAAFLFFSGKNESSPRPSPAPRKVASKKSLPVQNAAPRTNSVAKVEEKEEPEKNEYEKRFHDEKILSVETNSTGYVIVRAIQANGRPIRHVVPHKKIFTKATDQLIMVALTAREGQELPPFPNLGGAKADAEFLKSLETEIKDLPDDSDKARAYKQIVRAAREEIKERIENGEHFADILADQRKLHNENSKIRNGAVHELQSIVDSGDMAGARKYLSVMNAAFSQMGITQMDMPERTQDRLLNKMKNLKKGKEQ